MQKLFYDKQNFQLQIQYRTHIVQRIHLHTH